MIPLCFRGLSTPCSQFELLVAWQGCATCRTTSLMCFRTTRSAVCSDALQKSFPLFSAHASPPLATSQQLPTLQHHLCTEIVGTQGCAVASPWSLGGNQAGGLYWWPRSSCGFFRSQSSIRRISTREILFVKSGSLYEGQKAWLIGTSSYS